MGSLATMLLLLLPHQQIKAIFDGILCSAVKFLTNFRPSFAHSKEFFKECEVLARSPWALFEIWVHVACPVLTTLLWRSIYLVMLGLKIQILAYLNPLILAFLSELRTKLRYKPVQQLFLLLSPRMFTKIVFFQTEPFEHALPCILAWDKLCHIFPIGISLRSLHTLHSRSSYGQIFCYGVPRPIEELSGLLYSSFVSTFCCSSFYIHPGNTF